jgi:hypothetical protein
MQTPPKSSTFRRIQPISKATRPESTSATCDSRNELPQKLDLWSRNSFMNDFKKQMLAMTQSSLLKGSPNLRPFP